jgi:hypothetical protein
MNTMPQAFDETPVTRAGFSVSSVAVARRASAAHLHLVGGGLSADMGPAAAAAALQPPLLQPVSLTPYDLSARRHLARVPERQPRKPAQAPATQADNPGTASSDAANPPPSGSRLPLEPVVFALVLLMSVAALAVALRAG